jgi:hypothetical protein
MAILELPLGHFELTPGRQLDSEWIATQLDLRLTLAENVRVLLEDRHWLELRRPDFLRLVEGIRNFIASKVMGEDEVPDFTVPAEEFLFVPLELGFQFACVDGEVDESLAGEITVRIMINLDVVDYELSWEYVGGEFSVDSHKLLDFVQQLEHELLDL